MTESGEFTVAAARRAAEEGTIDEWVKAFLASDGSDNAALGEALAQREAHWTGPVRLPWGALHRLAGPADQPTLERMDDDDLDTVEEMVDSIEDGWSPPPLIVSYRDPQLVVEDGNHRIEGLRRAGHRSWWSMVCFDGRRALEAWEPPAVPGP